MTDAINASITSSALSSLTSSSTSTSAALTDKTKAALEALRVDTKSIKTEADGKTALVAAQKKQEAEAAQKASLTQKVDLSDEAAVYESSTQASNYIF